METEQKRKQKNSNAGRYLILAIFLTGVTGFFFFDLDRFLDLDALRENRETLEQFTRDHYIGTVLIFILAYCFQTTFSLPGGAIMTLTAGFLFGTLAATLYVNIGATSGALLAFLGARYLFRESIERRFGARLENILGGFNKNAMNYLLTLRLIPLFPFFLVNLASGLTRVRVSTYIIATAIGIIPGSFVYANAGKQLGTINSLGDIASPGVL
ncbi:MAG TPA: TVP38/TMEM64 family protein, partial [Nitrospiria bacterium]